MRQTFIDWELILVDDGSDESEFSRIHDFVNDDARITHIRRNRHPKNGDTCRNIGIDLARGEYILFFDADDLVSDTCFENRVSFMDRHSECDYATFPFSKFSDGTNSISSSVINRQSNDILSDLLSTRYPFTVWANIYRKEALADIRWDERVFVYQDFDFMLQCVYAKLKHQWADTDVSDYYYREFSNGDSVCANYVSQEKTRSTIYLFRKVNVLLEMSKNCQARKTSFLQFVILHLERLLLGGSQACINEYLEKVLSLYGIDIYTAGCVIAGKVHKARNPKLRKILVDYHLYRKFHYSIYRIQFLHDVAKLLLRR